MVACIIQELKNKVVQSGREVGTIQETHVSFVDGAGFCWAVKVRTSGNGLMIASIGNDKSELTSLTNCNKIKMLHKIMLGIYGLEKIALKDMVDMNCIEFDRYYTKWHESRK